MAGADRRRRRARRKHCIALWRRAAAIIFGWVGDCNNIAVVCSALTALCQKDIADICNQSCGTVAFMSLEETKEIIRLRAKLRAYALFYEDEYLQYNPDVRAAVKGGQFEDGFHHFSTRGVDEGRFPGFRGFNGDDYIAANGDLAHFRAEPDPEESARRHFKAAGYSEGRKLTP